MPGARRGTLRTARLTRRGACLAGVGGVSLVAAYASGRTEPIYLGVLLVLLPVLAALLIRYRRFGIDSSRVFVPAVVAIGQPTTVELTIANRSQVPTPPLTWRDYRPWTAGSNIPGSLPPLPGRRAAAPHGRPVLLRYELVAPRRGIFEVGPMSVVLTDPFALARGEVTVSGTDSLVVTPRIATLGDNGLAILASDGSSMLMRRAIGGEDDLSTREYRTGDAFRRVHWRATARHGELMVRHEEPRSHAEARVILDTRVSGYPDAVTSRSGAESESFELALALAASLSLYLARGGFEADIVETASQQLASVSPVEPFLRSLATARLRFETGRYGAESPLQAPPRLDRAHGSVFAVAADADEDTIDRLIVQRQSFDLAVAFLIDPSDSRQRGGPAAERLRRAGWTVVPVGLDDDVERVWESVAAVRGARHGR